MSAVQVPSCAESLHLDELDVERFHEKVARLCFERTLASLGETRPAVLIAVLLGLWAAAGCGEHHTAEPDVCAGLDAYFQTEWVRDGVPGQSMCNEPSSTVRRYDPGDIAGSVPALELSLGGVQERPGIPFCGATALFINTPLVTGETGSVSDDRWGYGDGWDPIVYVGLRTAPSEERCAAGGADFATVTGGTWEVLQGGDEGERVEVVIRDVTFAPYDGHTFEYTRFRFRGILGAGLSM